ncbi:MAG: hypothetical protein CMP56_02700 [Flavobacteriales bacterium]|nr:hypothetical protein [Flavobacteriales bacterium]|tara:strand:+ start:131 stop:337 length:207 start_codon:yes stop_codon:yes gene_type:complete
MDDYEIKIKKTDSISLSVKDFTEAKFKEIKINYDQTNNRNISELLNYVSEYQKLIISNNRELILSCVN